MSVRGLLFAAFIGLVGARCRGQESCPWINAGTASGILGGPVKSTFKQSKKSKGDGLCEFVRHDSRRAYIKVQVETGHFASLAASCHGNHVPLKAIGNEAIACAEPGHQLERVVGRVRDRTFVILIAGGNATFENARAVAEQVSGILF